LGSIACREEWHFEVVVIPPIGFLGLKKKKHAEGCH
jgi:hypothetical protein